MKYKIEAFFGGKSYWLHTDYEGALPSRSLYTSDFIWTDLEGASIVSTYQAQKWLALFLRADLKHMQTITLYRILENSETTHA